MSRQLADRVVTLFTAEDEPGLTALFDATMRTGVPPERLRDLWRRLKVASGSQPVVGEPVVAQVPGPAELFDYPLTYPRRRNHLQVVIREDLVAGLVVLPGAPTGRWKKSRGMWRQLLRLR